MKLFKETKLQADQPNRVVAFFRQSVAQLQRCKNVVAATCQSARISTMLQRQPQHQASWQSSESFVRVCAVSQKLPKPDTQRALREDIAIAMGEAILVTNVLPPTPKTPIPSRPPSKPLPALPVSFKLPAPAPVELAKLGKQAKPQVDLTWPHGAEPEILKERIIAYVNKWGAEAYGVHLDWRQTSATMTCKDGVTGLIEIDTQNISVKLFIKSFWTKGLTPAIKLAASFEEGRLRGHGFFDEVCQPQAFD